MGTYGSSDASPLVIYKKPRRGVYPPVHPPTPLSRIYFYCTRVKAVVWNFQKVPAVATPRIFVIVLMSTKHGKVLLRLCWVCVSRIAAQVLLTGPKKSTNDIQFKVETELKLFCFRRQVTKNDRKIKQFCKIGMLLCHARYYIGTYFGNRSCIDSPQNIKNGKSEFRWNIQFIHRHINDISRGNPNYI